MELDARALDDVGLGTDLPVTRELSGISLKSALNLMLKEYDLTWTVRDEVLLITTADEAEMNLITRVYPVGDLVLPQGTQENSLNSLNDADFEWLINTIANTIESEAWNVVGGGPGSITACESAAALVVSQSLKAHEQIESLLRSLRAARAVAVANQPVGNADAAHVVDGDGLVLHVYRVRQPADGQVCSESLDVAPQSLDGQTEPGQWEQQLGEALTALIAPESWEASGGPGKMRSVSGVLLIRQTPAVHAEIEGVLADLSAAAQCPVVQSQCGN